VVAKLQARYQASSGDEEEALASGWDLVHSIGIKTSGSVMLPIWSCKMDSRFEIVDGVAVKTQKKRKGEDASDDEDVDMERKKAVKKVKPAAKEDKAAVSPAKSPAKATAKSPAKVTTEQAPVAAATKPAAAAQPKKVMAGKATKEVKPAKKVSVTKAKPSAKQAVVGKKVAKK
jgi:ribosome biogenesis protein UTP30